MICLQRSRSRAYYLIGSEEVGAAFIRQHVSAMYHSLLSNSIPDQVCQRFVWRCGIWVVKWGPTYYLVLDGAYFVRIRERDAWDWAMWFFSRNVSCGFLRWCVSGDECVVWFLDDAVCLVGLGILFPRFDTSVRFIIQFSAIHAQLRCVHFPFDVGRCMSWRWSVIGRGLEELDAPSVLAPFASTYRLISIDANASIAQPPILLLDQSNPQSPRIG
jgi:hypothetical protein